MSDKTITRPFRLKGLGVLRKWGRDPIYAESGFIKIKPAMCGKGDCRNCPHQYFAYHCNRWGEIFLGSCDKKGNPIEQRIDPRIATKQTILSLYAK